MSTPQQRQQEPGYAPKIATPVKKTRAQIRKEQIAQRERFLRVRRAEEMYRRQLRTLGKQVGVIVEGHAPNGILADHVSAITSALDKYAELIAPWARAVGKRMLADVNKRDQKAWLQHSELLGNELRNEIRNSPTGETMRSLLDAQVDLITSIPRDAAKRVQKLALESVATGRRADEIADMLKASGKVAEHHAETIARTEVARAASTLSMARALHIGATQYIWRDAGDGNVRKEHKKLNGRVFEWTNPPIAGANGERANPGCIYNCRCFAEPVIPDDL